MQCDICGKDKQLVRAKIEGTIMNVCETCKRYGEEIKTPIMRDKIEHKVDFFEKDEAEVIKKDFAVIIKNAREAMKLKQEDFAKKINEKDSIIHQIETGHYVPNSSLARKIEHFLHVRLIEKVEQAPIDRKIKKDEDVMTLGHLMKK